MKDVAIQLYPAQKLWSSRIISPFECQYVMILLSSVAGQGDLSYEWKSTSGEKKRFTQRCGPQVDLRFAIIHSKVKRKIRLIASKQSLFRFFSGLMLCITLLNLYMQGSTLVGSIV